MHSSAQVLGLEDNALADWDEVLQLAQLPLLQRLQLGGNRISHVTYPQNSQGVVCCARSVPSVVLRGQVACALL